MKLSLILLVPALTLAAAALAPAKTLSVPSKFPTIQAAVDAAQQGDVIRIKSGKYPQSAAATNKAGLTIRGGGKTILTGDGTPGTLRFLNCTNLELRNLRFEGGVKTNIFFESCENVKIVGCRLEKNGPLSPVGILALACSEVRLDHVRLRGVRFSAAARLGDITDPCSGVTVTRCRFADCDNGLSIAGSNVTVTKCRFDRSHGRHLDLLPGLEPGKCVVTKNKFNESLIDAIYAYTNQLTRIEKNKIRRAGTYGIYVPAGETVLIRKNQLRDVVSAGIYCAQPGSVIEQNDIVRPRIGIEIDAGCDGCELADNDVEEARKTGIAIRGNQFSLVGNRVMDTAGNGVEIDANSGTCISNVVNDAFGIGMRVTGTGNQLKKNSGHGSFGADLLIDAAQNSVAENNDFGVIEPLL